MTACEAMIVAAVAKTTIGIRPQVGTRRKKGFAIAAGLCRIRPAWPR